MTDRDRNEMLILDEDDCWERLGATPVGRIAYCQAGGPQIVPVNHTVIDGDVVIASRPGSKLDHVLDTPGTAVAYEVDGIDTDEQTGWSVVVHGSLRAVTEEVERTTLRRSLDPSWLDSFRDTTWLVLEVDEVSGRRLDRAAQAPRAGSD